jgi:hypothetical protein
LAESEQRARKQDSMVGKRRARQQVEMPVGWKMAVSKVGGPETRPRQ